MTKAEVKTPQAQQLCMPLIISRTCSSVLPTIGSIVVLSFLLVTATSGGFLLTL